MSGSIPCFFRFVSGEKQAEFQTIDNRATIIGCGVATVDASKAPDDDCHAPEVTRFEGSVFSTAPLSIVGVSHHHPLYSLSLLETKYHERVYLFNKKYLRLCSVTPFSYVAQ